MGEHSHVMRADKASIGEHLKQARIDYLRPKKLSQRAAAAMIAEHLSARTLSRESLAKYESNDQPTPYDVAEAAEKAFGLRGGALTAVYYNKSGEGADTSVGGYLMPKFAHELERRVYSPVVILKPRGAAHWVAKEVNRVTKHVPNWVSEAWGYISPDRKMGDVRPGMILVMMPDDYPGEDVFRVFRKKSDPDTFVLGWIEPMEPSMIVTEYGDRLKLSEYAPEAFAYAACWGVGDTLDEVRVSGRGIGPKTLFK